MNARWAKLWRDARTAGGRLLLLAIALATSLAALTAITTGYTILQRELPANYLNTRPAQAQLELDGIDDALVRAVSARPDVAIAEAASVVTGRIEAAPGVWMPLRLFVVPDFAAWRLNTVAPERVDWPPRAGALLLERTALPLTRHAVGQNVRIETASGAALTLPIAGTVHDAGVAPAWQEQTVYGYIDRTLLQALGESDGLHILKVSFRSGGDAAFIEKQARELAQWLGTEGHPVHEIRVPPPGRHPHQGQMNAVMSMLQIFGLLALVLGAVLAATTLSAILAQQTRQIAVMKAIGARAAQIALMYAAPVSAIAIVSAAIGLALGMGAGRGLAVAVADLLNLRLTSVGIPASTITGLFTLGVIVPALAAALPIASAARRTVRSAIDDHGISRPGSALDRALSRWSLPGVAATLALRNAFRRRGRLLWNLALLALAGATFIAAADLRAAWQRNVVDSAADRHYQFELQLQQDMPESALLDAVRTDADVAAAEAWSVAVATPDRGDGVELAKTYPDGAHGGLALRAVPQPATLVTHRVSAGRWLNPDAVDEVVLNGLALSSFPNAKPGDRIDLRADGRRLHLRVAGIVREELTPAAAYVNSKDFARLLESQARANAVRVAVRADADVDAVLRRIELGLEQRGSTVKLAITERQFGAAQAGHVYILVFALLLIAAAMTTVAALGLASSLGTAVLERTRELGVLRAIGARSRDITRSMVVESAVVGALSSVFALIVAWPVSLSVGAVLASISRIPLAPTLTLSAAGFWLALVTVVAILASLVPAWRAARLTIWESLSFN